MMTSKRPSPILCCILLFASSCLVSGELHARIESCSGWKLNKLPNLESFLNDGEAESYKNVQLTSVPGNKATMTIYEGVLGRMEEKEKIVLSDYNTMEEMHSLMIEKGFELRSDEEIEALKLQKQKEAAEFQKRREESRRKREEEKARRMREDPEREKMRDEMERNGEL